jgi:RimK family alpha-L-glutamate ligase
MKLAVVYGEVSTEHHLLIDRAEDIFDKVVAAPVEGLKFIHSEDGDKVLYKDVDLTEFDALYFRCGDSDMMFAEHLTEIMNRNGVYTPAEDDTFQYESNKFYNIKALSKYGIPAPNSVYTISPEIAVDEAEKIGYPVIMKTVRGGGGQGVMRAGSEKELKPVMDTMKSLEQEICLQEYKEHNGQDNRIIIIGEDIKGYGRKSKGSEWRSNISEGGERITGNLTEEMKKTAEKASKAVGFDICGTDVIESQDGDVYVLEINGAFGISEEMNELIGEDVILEMVEEMHQRALKNQNA